jgi:integrase
MCARWEEIDFDAAVWRIPAERMKKRKEHTIPLPRQAIEVLQSMKNFTGHRKHVFPHRDKRDEAMTDQALRMALRHMGWGGRYSPHATRTTGSTRLNEMGFPADWIERQLAHTEPNGVRRTYNHADHFDDRRKMMEQWACMLEALTNNDGSGKVIVANFRKAV